jgi:hypothetical protein
LQAHEVKELIMPLEYPDELIIEFSIEDVDVAAICALNFHCHGRKYKSAASVGGQSEGIWFCIGEGCE